MILFSRILSKRLHMNPTRAVLDLTSKQLQLHTFYSWETQHAWHQLQTAPHFLLWWLHFLLLWSGDVPLLLSPPTKAAWRSHSCSPALLGLGFRASNHFNSTQRSGSQLKTISICTKAGCPSVQRFLFLKGWSWQQYCSQHQTCIQMNYKWRQTSLIST